MKINSMDLVIIIPVFNEEKIIYEVIREIILGTENIKKKNNIN